MLILNERSLFTHSLFNNCVFVTVLELSGSERFRGRSLFSLSGPFNEISMVEYCLDYHSKHLLFYIVFSFWSLKNTKYATHDFFNVLLYKCKTNIFATTTYYKIQSKMLKKKDFRALWPVTWGASPFRWFKRKFLWKKLFALHVLIKYFSEQRWTKNITKEHNAFVISISEPYRALALLALDIWNNNHAQSSL